MDTKQLLSELRAERDRISQAIAAIENLGGADRQASGRGKTTARAGRPAASKPPVRRKMSRAARKRISEAAKRRWAERKKAAAKA